MWRSALEVGFNVAAGGIGHCFFFFILLVTPSLSFSLSFISPPPSPKPLVLLLTYYKLITGRVVLGINIPRPSSTHGVSGQRAASIIVVTFFTSRFPSFEWPRRCWYEVIPRRLQVTSSQLRSLRTLSPRSFCKWSAGVDGASHIPWSGSPLLHGHSQYTYSSISFVYFRIVFTVLLFTGQTAQTAVCIIEVLLCRYVDI